MLSGQSNIRRLLQSIKLLGAVPRSLVVQVLVSVRWSDCYSVRCSVDSGSQGLAALLVQWYGILYFGG
jgi:hypothetical protein